MRCASPSFAFSLIMMGHDDNNNNNGSAFAFLQSHVSFTLLTMYIVYGYFVTIHDFFFIYTYYIIHVFSYMTFKSITTISRLEKIWGLI